MSTRLWLEGGELGITVIGRGGVPAVLPRGSVSPSELPVESARVLIVDDEADVIQALKLRLETAGYDAVTACDGAEALKMLQNIQPDLILTDLMMPNLDGLELTRRVRQNPSWFQVQVLMFSCHDDPVARGLALEFGALDYLSKTLGAPAIVSRVREILARSKPAEAATGRKGPPGDDAERDLITQLQAISQNSAGTLSLSPEIPNSKHEGSEPSGAGAADDLRNLANALRRHAKAGHSQRPDRDR